MAVRSVALKKQQPAFENDQQLFDTHPEVRLDFDRVRGALKEGYTKPFLLVDTQIVRTKARRFKAAMPRVHPHYAVKANPNPRVLKALIEEGVGFEIASIAELVNHGIRDIPQSVRIMAEPGRFLVSDAGYFVCRVVGTATRGGKRWMYWDAGVFGGVIETTEGLRYDIHTDRTGKVIPWCIAGPTCDSVDVCMRYEMFPEDMQEGDFIYIANAGAYTTAYASNFNGFPLPDVRVI